MAGAPSTQDGVSLMGSTRALLLAGAVALGVADAAQAADLPLAPPLPSYVPEPVAFSSWYIRGDVGAGLSFGPDIRSTFFDETTGDFVPDYAEVRQIGRDRQRLGDSGFVDIGVGYQFNNWLRLDATAEVRSAARFSTVEHYSNDFIVGAVPGQFGQDIYNGSVQSSVFLANAYVDLGTWYGITPYIGGGVGAAYNHLAALTDINPGSLVNYTDQTSGIVGLGGGGFANAKGGFSLAYAGMLGFSYDITSELKLDIGYRYLNMGSITSNNIVCLGGAGSCGGAYERQRISLSSNDVRVGLRWLINDDVPAPPLETPIIRKD